MPAYDTISAPVFNPGRPIMVWDDEDAGPSGEAIASQQICLHRYELPTCMSVEVEFADDPGAFQLDLQVADTDAEKYYVTKASLAGDLNASFVGRIEVTNVVAKFARLKMISLANAVNVTARIF